MVAHQALVHPLGAAQWRGLGVSPSPFHLVRVPYPLFHISRRKGAGSLTHVQVGWGRVLPFHPVQRGEVHLSRLLRLSLCSRRAVGRSRRQAQRVLGRVVVLVAHPTPPHSPHLQPRLPSCKRCACCARPEWVYRDLRCSLGLPTGCGCEWCGQLPSACSLLLLLCRGSGPIPTLG